MCTIISLLLYFISANITNINKIANVSNMMKSSCWWGGVVLGWIIPTWVLWSSDTAIFCSGYYYNYLAMVNLVRVSYANHIVSIGYIYNSIFIANEYYYLIYQHNWRVVVPSFFLALVAEFSGCIHVIFYSYVNILSMEIVQYPNYYLFFSVFIQ